MSQSLDDLRDDLLTASLILDSEGLVEAYGHVSARIPGQEAMVMPTSSDIHATDPPPDQWPVPPGWTLIYRRTTGSTNDDAKRAAHDGTRGRTVYLTDEQTAGRGRYGRDWVAPAGTCLLFSLLLAETLDPIDCTVAASVAVAETITDRAALPARIKWPNDVMVGNRKVCGVLTEVVASSDRFVTVVGIGLNVNLDLATEGLPTTATSPAAELGHPLSRAVLFSAILARLDELLSLEASQVLPVLHDRWEALLWRRSQIVRLSDGASILDGVVEGLAPSGGLLVRLNDGTRREVMTGELLLD